MKAVKLEKSVSGQSVWNFKQVGSDMKTNFATDYYTEKTNWGLAVPAWPAGCGHKTKLRKQAPPIRRKPNTQE